MYIFVYISIFFQTHTKSYVSISISIPIYIYISIYMYAYTCLLGICRRIPISLRTRPEWTSQKDHPAPFKKLAEALCSAPPHLAPRQPLAPRKTRCI